MLNQRIREARTARRMSQVELAAKVGVTKQSLSNWENDNIQPSIDMLGRLCFHLNVSADYLLGLDDRMYIEASGLTMEEIAHLQEVINDIRLARQQEPPRRII